MFNTLFLNSLDVVKIEQLSFVFQFISKSSGNISKRIIVSEQYSFVPNQNFSNLFNSICKEH